MSQWLTVWRAAHLVGVSRGVLQQRVRSGELPISDGLVSTEALLRLYPQAQLEPEGGASEQVAAPRREGEEVGSHLFQRPVRLRNGPVPLLIEPVHEPTLRIGEVVTLVHDGVHT